MTKASLIVLMKIKEFLPVIRNMHLILQDWQKR
jgi:hypothetical protein